MFQSSLMPPTERGILPVRSIAAAGLSIGIAGDLLLRNSTAPGLNLLLLFTLLALAMAFVSRASGVSWSLESRVSLAVGLLFAAGLATRSSPALQMLAFFGAAAAFAFPALHAGRGWLLRSGIGQQVEAIVCAGIHSGLGAMRLVLLSFSRETPDPSAASGRRHVFGLLRGLFMAVPFLLVFGALFMSADRVFARMVTDLVTVDIEEIVSHVVPIVVLSWLTCGFLTGLLTGTHAGLPGGASLNRPSIGILEAGTLLALVDLLFAAFVSVQFRYLFGGSGLVEVTPGLTYAEYAREGFAQLAVASALVLPSLLLLDWLVLRHRRRDEWTFRILGGTQLLLLLVIVASAFQRLRSYQDAYGLTESRFYGAVFLTWLTLLTVWFALTVLNGRRRRFAFPALTSAYVVVALLFVLNPAGYIARVNLERASIAQDPIPASSEDTGTPGEVDIDYLASLGADAVPTLLEGLTLLSRERRCELAEHLVERWGPDRQSDWRAWTWSHDRAGRSVGSGRLRALMNENGCT